MLPALTMLLCSVVVSAHDFEVDGIYYNINGNNEVSVTYKGNNNSSYEDEYSGDVVIPETVTYNGKTYSVTSIGMLAFYECTNLWYITIPKSVKSIESLAFTGCTNLNGVYINDIAAWCNINYSSEGGWPLTYAENLYLNGELVTELVIPDSITSIAYKAFANCKSIVNITIPESVTSIGYDAFNGTTWYNNQPDGFVYAGKVLYKYKGTMPSGTSINIKEGTLGIAGGAFYDCTGLTSITIPNSVTSIGSWAFEDCSGLTSITIPNSVTSIGDNAFSYCTGLTSITIPNSVTSIENYAFYDCSGLTSITIPNSVTSIGYRAFCSCSGLKKVIIGNSVTSIEESAFEGCDNIFRLLWLCKTPPEG